jgi:hypothetical protein
MMQHVWALVMAMVVVTSVAALGEATLQNAIGSGAQAQHSRHVRDQACYRRCRNDMRKPSSSCNRLCRR